MVISIQIFYGRSQDKIKIATKMFVEAQSNHTFYKLLYGYNLMMKCNGISNVNDLVRDAERGSQSRNLILHSKMSG